MTIKKLVQLFIFNSIYDSEICNRNSGYLNYSEFYSFFQVNISNMI